jgi:putative Ca2+/H+ antiporter (TMEM165/GDT1 family)
MWLPRPLYEAKPYLVAAAGLACLVVAWFVERSPRSVLLVAGAVFLVLGLLLWMHRRDYRATQSTYDPHSIDE